MPLYDAIVIGARCAGSPTAMLLARKGYRVLLVDRATFPSDTISTHLIHPPGVAALARWGLLDRLVATGCPAIGTYVMDMGPFVLAAPPGPPESPVSYGPRRTILDKLLVDAAVESGVEVREAFTVDEVLMADGRVTGIRGHARGGQPIDERARVVVGADGVSSIVARSVSPRTYQEQPPLEAGYYTYWSDLPLDGQFRAFDRGDRAWASWPTHDGLTVVVVSWPIAEFEANKRDVERHYLDALERAPAFAECVRAATRADRFYGTTVPNYFRQPYGPGWALVGDAGYLRDFITAQGISDAFRDAERSATALDEALSGARPFEESMAGYQRARDAQVTPMYNFTLQFARLAPPPPEMQQLMAAVHASPEATTGFIQVVSGVRSAAEFFAPENVGRILGNRAAD